MRRARSRSSARSGSGCVPGRHGGPFSAGDAAPHSLTPSARTVAESRGRSAPACASHSMSRIRVRLLKTQGEFRQCERLQQIVWGTLGVSSEVMTVTQKYGGVVLGAFVGDRLAGFICAFLARRRDRLIHWSHMMAVAPEDRDRGLGFRMKLEHRRLALARGIKSICWTYDPLQSRNAALNVSRLGARVEEYVPDCYGHFPSRIEKGLASDRFVVNWRIALPVVARRLKKAPPAQGSLLLPRVNETRLNAQGLLVNRKIFWGVHEPRLLVEIPSNTRSEEHTSELQSRLHLVCRLLLEKKKKTNKQDAYNM